MTAPPLTCLPASSPRKRGEERLPRAAAPFLDFCRLLRRHGFPVAPEQATGFMRAVEALGPRSMDDIRQAALAMLAPSPERQGAFEALFRGFFRGETSTVIDGSPDEEETIVKDEGASEEVTLDEPRQEEGGDLSSALEKLGVREFAGIDDPLGRFRRALGPALPVRRSFRTIRADSRGRLDLRRSLGQIVTADGDVPVPLQRRRKDVPRPLLLLIDVSGSMKQHTADYLKLAHAIVQGADRAEVFTFGTRLTRLTSALRIRDRDRALEAAATRVEDWDGGTRIGASLLAFLSVPRFSAFARGAAVILLSDALERGDHSEMETAIRRLGQRAFRPSLATPLAGDPRFRPQTAALQAILPVLDDLVDGSSLAALIPFILSLAHPAPTAATAWRTS
jgi:uncharacterized protein with von Willebrand factor type A (vWA) domain